MPLPFSSAVVTGGGGFVGSHLVDRLMEEGAAVTVLDNFGGGSPSNLSAHAGSPRLKILNDDIANGAAVREALRGAEVVFHEAAIVNVQRSLREPELTYAVNVEGTKKLLDTAITSGVEKFVFASSAAVYGNSQQLPRAEGMPLSPASPYAVSKMRAEALVEDAHSRTGIGTTSLRYFNIYGPRSTSKAYSGVINAFARRVIEGRHPVVYGDGNQSRDFVAVSDIVAANILAASSKNSSGRTFNVGTGVKTTILELAFMIIRILGGEVDQDQVEFKPFREGEVRESYADISLIMKELGFVPNVGLKDGLAEYLDSTFSRGEVPEARGGTS